MIIFGFFPSNTVSIIFVLINRIFLFRVWKNYLLDHLFVYKRERAKRLNILQILLFY